MKFGELAGYFEKLEKVSSRLEMTRILADLLGEVDSGEAKLISYLSQGQLGPKYDNPQFGMADKQVIKAIASRFEMESEAVNKDFKQSGDLGLAAEGIVKVKSKSKKEMSIGEVYVKLSDIAGASGAGSQDGKIKLLGDLLEELDPKSAKYVVRIVLGKMRTGFSDMTILDAVSWMATGDKSLRPEIEQVYNVRADLGEAVKRIKEEMEKPAFHKDPKAAVKAIKAEPVTGTPILVARGERAKTIEEIWERNGVSAAEHKLDGLRLQAHIKGSAVKLFSRGMENVTVMYPDVVEGLKKQIDAECILDGEMIAVDKSGKYMPFQETVQRKRKYGILEMLESVPLKYYVFDVLYAEGKNYLNKSNETRWARLEEIVGPGDVVRLMPRRIVKSVDEIEKFFREALAEGTEGIFVKKLDGVYRSGSRDFNWIKYKKSYDQSGVADNVDAVVLGYDRGEGKRSGFGIGGFLIGVSGKGEKFLTVAKIGTGLKDNEWRELKKRCGKIERNEKPANYEVNKQMNCDVWVNPEIVVEIKADEITKSPVHSSGYAMRFPRLVAFREMSLSDITTADEIKRLFDIQRGGG